MNTYLLAIGRLRPSFRAAADEYLVRLRRYGEVIEREIKEAPAAKPPSDRVRDEGRRLLEKVPDPASLIALDRAGASLSSEAVAERLARWRVGAKPIVLVIGGALGLDRSVLARADFRWSLGPLTLPHELARVVVLEQWYRAWTILRGEQYHK